MGVVGHMAAGADIPLLATLNELWLLGPSTQGSSNPLKGIWLEFETLWLFCGSWRQEIR